MYRVASGWSCVSRRVEHRFALAERAELAFFLWAFLLLMLVLIFSLLRIMTSVVLIGTRRRNRCSPQICVTIILKCWLQEAEGRKSYIYTPRFQFVIEGNQA